MKLSIELNQPIRRLLVDRLDLFNRLYIFAFEPHVFNINEQFFGRGRVAHLIFF